MEQPKENEWKQKLKRNESKWNQKHKNQNEDTTHTTNENSISYVWNELKVASRKGNKESIPANTWCHVMLCHKKKRNYNLTTKIVFDDLVFGNVWKSKCTHNRIEVIKEMLQQKFTIRSNFQAPDSLRLNQKHQLNKIPTKVNSKWIEDGVLWEN